MSFDAMSLEFQSAIKNRLPKSVWSNYVDIRLDPLGMAVTIPGSGRSVEHSGRALFANGGELPWLVVGEPGSGKSTMLANLVEEMLNEGRWTFFLPMASYDSARELVQFFAAADVDAEAVAEIRARGDGIFILDALDEARAEELGDLFEVIIEWSAESVRLGNTVIVSCRTAEVPGWVHMRVAEAMMLPVPDEEIDRLFEETRTKRNRSTLEADPLDGLYRELREVCRNPLLLMMTIYLYQTDGLTGLQGISSRASLYRYFFDELGRWDQIKRAPTASETAFTAAVREALYSNIGYRMHESGRVYVREADLQKWIAELFRSQRMDYLFSSKQPPTVAQAFDYIVLHAPMNARALGALGGYEYGFVHQTFGDVFAAMEIAAGTDPIVEAEQLIADRSRRHWEVLVPLAGILDAPDELTRSIARIAFEQKRQDLLLLSARCIRDRWNMPRSEADDLCMRILEAFKYWEEFDYALIHALKELPLSGSFPRRLRRDHDRFVRKYAEYVPAELVNSSLEDLVRYLSSEDLTTSCNAAYSLGGRDYHDAAQMERIVLALQNRAETAPAVLHEQIVAALKEIASPLSRAWLEAVCQDAQAPERSRAFALNGLGRIGDVRSVDVVISYMRNHNNLYRDSASWSLQSLAKEIRWSHLSVYGQIIGAYSSCLESESGDVEGVFAKGNIMYSLGVLGAKEHLPEIISCVETADDPYVVEDGLNAIGLVGSEVHGKFLARYLDHYDPVVRLKAAEALLKINAQRFAADVRPMLLDTCPMVRDALRTELRKVNIISDPLESKTLQESFASPLIERDRVVVRLSRGDAALVAELGETLLQQRQITSRPKIDERVEGTFVTMSNDAFDVIRSRIEESARRRA